MKKNSFAFFVWNPFQLFQFENLFEAMPNAHIVIINQDNNIKNFNFGALDTYRASYQILEKKEVPFIDGKFDVIFFQSPFPFIEKIRKSRLVSIQYGLAKERHNYGEWRSLADMNLMYGRYSADYASHFSPSYPVGNVKFAEWDYNHDKKCRKQIEHDFNINSARKNVLYMPTYGELGSFDVLLPYLEILSRRQNVIIKMHHNNEKRNYRWIKSASDRGLKHLMSGGADQRKLLAISDLVISDYSGAIFDAIYAQVPVLLFQENTDLIVGKQKFFKTSIEYRRRDELGTVCTSTTDFIDMVEAALAGNQELVSKASIIRDELFLDGTTVDTIGLIKQKVTELLNNQIPSLTPQQYSVRETVQDLRSRRRSITDLKSPILKAIGNKLKL